MLRIIALFVFLLSISYSQTYYDLHETLMKSTYKISNGNSLGTGFIVGKPIQIDSIKTYKPVLVTAAHVLNGFKSGEMKIHFRKKVKDDYIKFIIKVKITKNNKPLWVKHPKADVAAIYVVLPPKCDRDLITYDLLVTDNILKDYEINAGYTVFALGFPFGAESNSAGVPILRTGTISSYPILPTSKTKEFLVDFEVFPGNSGGPVYVVQRGRSYIKKGDMGIVRFRFVMGIVSEELNIKEHVRSMYESRIDVHPLKVAKVIHASLIRETIDLLR